MTQRFLEVDDRSRLMAERRRRYWGQQYDHLPEYGSDEAEGLSLREVQPALKVRLTAAAVDTVNAYLFGAERGPSFIVTALAEMDDLDEAELAARSAELELELAAANRQLQRTLRETRLAARLPELGRLGLIQGTIGLAGHQSDTGRQWSEVLGLIAAYPVFGSDDRAQADALELEEDDLLELDEYWLELDTADGEEVWMVHRRKMTVHRTEY